MKPSVWASARLFPRSLLFLPVPRLSRIGEPGAPRSGCLCVLPVRLPLPLLLQPPSFPMPNTSTLRLHRLPFSSVALTLALVVTLGVAYIALIAVVMSYAALTVEFAQSVRSDEAVIATLEARYLGTV